jgi:hypothetical protein
MLKGGIVDSTKKNADQTPPFYQLVAGLIVIQISGTEIVFLQIQASVALAMVINVLPRITSQRAGRMEASGLHFSLLSRRCHPSTLLLVRFVISTGAHIQPAFEKLTTGIDDHVLQKLVQYISKTWINNFYFLFVEL